MPDQTPDDLAARRRELKSRCAPLQGGGPRRPADLLARAAAWCRDNDVEFDQYGTGPVIEDLEARVADLLGFPAARFLPSGTLAQPMALRIWSDRAGGLPVGMHPTAHLELHEERGYARLWGLQATLVGPRDRPLLARHLEAVPERLAALLVELPIREAGGQLPTWDQLTALKAAARSRRTRLHLDGARLWECGPAYGRPYSAICEGFDSCYVSFYKGVGALAGSMLLGPRDFIADAHVWQRRAGGNLWSQVASVATAAMLLDERLARMPAWLGHARAIADALRGLPGLRLLPDPPHVNMLHVYLPFPPDVAARARDRVAEEHAAWLFSDARPGQMPGTSCFEWYLGEAAMAWEPEALRAAYARLLALGAADGTG